MTPNGVVLVRPKTKSITDIAGFLQPNSPDTDIDVDEMNPWRGALTIFDSTAI